MNRWAACLAGWLAVASLAQPPPGATEDDDDKALEDAFAPPSTATPSPGPPQIGADVPPPKVAEQPPETEEERAERDLASRLAAAATDADLAALAKEAAAMGPLPSLRVAERWASTAAAAHAPAPARAAHARAWLLACGPGSAREAARCRDRALDALRESGAPGKAEATRLEEADRCVASASPTERACLSRAIAAYRRSRDRLMVARATLAGLKPEDAVKRRAALKLCPDPRCASMRAATLEQLAADELEAGQAEPAVRDALEAIKQRRVVLPASQRLYARTDALDRACAAFERAAPRGKCRALEHEALGGYVFRDYSRKSGATLSASEAREATDHYSVLLTPCLSEYGEKSGSGRYKISWTILNDGRVTNVDAVNIDPQGRMMGCLKSQFTRWRYPRY
ncbi:MAG TPA: hypothetical protein VND93_03985 [Myxococcales bacterium]|nr:hypothetical protein [Myxococcales bacterium]